MTTERTTEDEERTGMRADTTERDRAVAAALRRLRLSRGLALRDVAAATNVPPSALGAYERSERTIPATRLGELCDFYGVAMTDLVDLEHVTDRSLGNSRPKVRFDFNGLVNAKSPEAKATAKVVEAIRQLRSTIRPSDGAIVIRDGDLLVVSAALGLTVEGLAHRLRAEGLLRRPTGRRGAST
jgi:transcriptional regulator with XRE-family HTH domain